MLLPVGHLNIGEEVRAPIGVRHEKKSVKPAPHVDEETDTEDNHILPAWQMFPLPPVPTQVRSADNGRDEDGVSLNDDEDSGDVATGKGELLETTIDVPGPSAAPSESVSDGEASMSDSPEPSVSMVSEPDGEDREEE